MICALHAQTSMLSFILIMRRERGSCMDIQQWQSMLERRGYEVEVGQDGGYVQYMIEGVVRGRRPAHQFGGMSDREARKQIGQNLGHGMRHGLHTCGCP